MKYVHIHSKVLVPVHEIELYKEDWLYYHDLTWLASEWIDHIRKKKNVLCKKFVA